MKIKMSVIGLDEIISRFARWPGKMTDMISETMQAGLYVLQENVPPYPPPPEGSTYRRTGQLGRSLGVSQEGQSIGQADIFVVRKEGNFTIGEFGTNLDYAQAVIGEESLLSQYVLNDSYDFSYWWKLKDVAVKATGKIESLFQIMFDKAAEWLNK